MSELVYKDASIPYKEMDDSTGYLAGYANVYSVKDLVGDISNPTSFVKTVSERKAKVKIYKNHDNNVLVGVPQDLNAQDPYGLWVGAKMLMDTAAGKDAYLESKFLVENGFESGFSIGGRIISRNKNRRAEVMEYSLDEISVLTKEQANSGSMVSVIKSLEELTEVTQAEFWRIVTKAYDNHNFSDEVKKSLETFLSLTDKPDLKTEETTLTVEPASIIKSIYSQYV